ncbi:MAG: hypothetical protein ACRCS9_14495 [Hyphomicrobium sp.]
MFGRLILALFALALLSGCAAKSSQTAGLAILPGSVPGPADDTETSAKDEAEPDCSKITGRMQVRILSLRAQTNASRTSGLSRTMQAAGKTLFGGTDAGTDPDGDTAQAIEQLKGFNSKLVAMDCRSFDLNATLAGTDTPPQPTIAAPSKAKAATPVR